VSKQAVKLQVSKAGVQLKSKAESKGPPDTSPVGTFDSGSLISTSASAG